MQNIKKTQKQYNSKLIQKSKNSKKTLSKYIFSHKKWTKGFSYKQKESAKKMGLVKITRKRTKKKLEQDQYKQKKKISKRQTVKIKSTIDEYQCEFEKERLVVDQIFRQRKIQAQNKDCRINTFLLFIYFKQTYNRVKTN